MCQPLFARVDVVELAARGSRITDSLPVGQCKRLVPLLAQSEAGTGSGTGSSEIALELYFSRDGSGLPLIAGGIEAELELQCQRCLEPVRVRVEATLRLAVIDSDARLGILPDGYEPLIAPDGKLRIADIVEEEMLLSVPAVPVHADRAGCGALTEYLADSDEAPGGQDEERDNPFAVLKNLRTTD